MATFVLVHGAWAGGWVWKYVLPFLRDHGHEVYTPTLTGLGERVHLAGPDVDLDIHIEDIVNLLIYEDLHDVFLVGWSYSGMVITGVLDRAPERLAHVVYLDAELPDDGESEFDIAGPEFQAEMEESARATGEGWKASLGCAADIDAFFAGWLPDPERRGWFVSKIASSPQPIKTFSQPVRLSNRAANSVARTFIRCPVDGEVWAGIYDPILERLRQDPNWNIIELPSNHLAPIADPDLVGEALLRIVQGQPAKNDTS